MTATSIPAPRTSVAAKVAAKVVAYLRLGKARIYQHAYGWLLAVLLLNMDGLVTKGTTAAVVLGLVVVVTTQWSAGAADDLGGYRDGSDARNYAGRPARTVAKKPLITGAVTESEAVVFGVVCWLVAAGSAVLALASLDWRSPVVADVLMFWVLVCSVQYSTGLKLSYRPLGLEFTIFSVIGGSTLMTYWVIAGTVNAEVLFTGALLGLWFLLIVFYGNASDREGDKEVNRSTLAVLLPPAAFKVALVVLFAASVTLLTLLFTTTRLSPVLALTAVPVVVLHAVQLYYGVVRTEWRRARFIGLSSVDLGCLGLAAAFVLS